ncbi:helix-turn-helix transcriptional regulator [Aeromonas veronii]
MEIKVMLITIKQLCNRLAVSRATVHRLRREPKAAFPKAIPIGPKSIRFDEAEVEQWLASRSRRVLSR